MNSDISAKQIETRILKRVLVRFGPGASVLSIEHPSDYSAIRISCTMPQCNAENFAIYMFELFREPVGLSRIHVFTGPDACAAVAHVQVKDPSFAARIKSKFDGYLRCVPRSRIAIKKVAVDINYEASVNTPNLTPITRHILQSRHASLAIKKDAAVSECVVCLTEAEDPYLTACGHFYCRACFRSQSINEGEIPIRCLGNSGKCSRSFLLPELKLVLQPEAFEQLLDKSFAIYIKTIESIQECPTSHCQKTYRTTTDGTVITCFECSTPICTTCQAPSHSGMTCAMYQRIGTTEYETWSFNKNIRKCPRCRNLIEKTGGCESVDCRCGARLCWKCMEVWDENRQCRCLRARWGSEKSKGGSSRDEPPETGGNGR